MNLIALFDLALLLLGGVVAQTANKTDDTIHGLAVEAYERIKDARAHALTQERLLNYHIEPRW